jgi:drug/metabolite transporter (DMT)-like permease
MRNTNLAATLIVILSGTLWGFYWLPVRVLAGLGLSGAWGTLLIVAAAVLLLSPFAYQSRHLLRRADRLGLASVALGGLAFALYSVGLLYGRVAIIVILFFLTPVWSTLIGHFAMGWRASRLRVLALLLGVAGLVLMLGAKGEVPVPRGLGEWLGLSSGFLWAVATTGIRVRSDTAPFETAFVFALGACLGSLLMAPLLEPAPVISGDALTVLLLGLGTGGLWWGAAMAALMWAATRLEPARVGILLMSEVLIGAASAALIAGEVLSLPELLGGALVVAAGVLEVLPERARA